MLRLAVALLVLAACLAQEPALEPPTLPAPPGPPAASATAQNDRQILLGFAENISNWDAVKTARKLQGWTECTASSCQSMCSWSGVMCGGTDGNRVVSLDLSCRGCSVKMSGPLAASLADLGSLQTMDLSGNQLTGSLPDYWGQQGTFLSLVELNLNDNQLSGPIPDTWGKESSFTALYNLQLASNQLSGTIPEAFATSETSWRELKALNLMNNKFTGRLPPRINGMTTMDYVAFSGNQFTGPLPSQWGQQGMEFSNGTVNNTQALAVLLLDNNNLSGTLPPEWGSPSSFTALRTLTLNNNNLSGTLPLEWAALSMLESLDISSSGLGGPLPGWGPGPSNLKTLQMFENNFTGYIPHSWANISSLSKVDLQPGNAFLCPQVPPGGTFQTCLDGPMCIAASNNSACSWNYTDPVLSIRNPIISAPGSSSSSSSSPNSSSNSTSDGSNSSSDSGGSSFPVAAVVAPLVAIAVLAALLAGLLVLRRRRRRRATPLEKVDSSSKDMVSLEAGGSSSIMLDPKFMLDSKHIMESDRSLQQGELDVVLSDWQISPDEIKVLKRPDGTDWKLGSGGFGTVYKAVRNGVQPVAVKVLKDGGDAHRMGDANFVREICILRACRDANILQFAGAYVQDDHLCLVTEYMEGGSLTNNLRSNRVTWYKRGKRIALDLARALVYLHSKKIAHMDVKSANVLLSRDGTAKLADVGMARILADDYVTGVVGTLAWSAPEMLWGHRCTSKADIYSFGVVLWEIATGETPVRGQLRDPIVPDECPEEVCAIMTRCLDPDPDNRPTAVELVSMLMKAPGTSLSGQPSADSIRPMDSMLRPMPSTSRSASLAIPVWPEQQPPQAQRLQQSSPSSGSGGSSGRPSPRAPRPPPVPSPGPSVPAPATAPAKSGDAPRSGEALASELQRQASLKSPFAVHQ